MTVDSLDSLERELETGDEGLLVVGENRVGRRRGAGHAVELRLVIVEREPDGLAQVPVEAEAVARALVDARDRIGKERERRIVDLQVGVAGGDFERAPGAL